MDVGDIGRDHPREIERRFGDRKAVAGVVDDAHAGPEFVAERDQLAAGEILVVLDDDRHGLPRPPSAHSRRVSRAHWRPARATPAPAALRSPHRMGVNASRISLASRPLAARMQTSKSPWCRPELTTGVMPSRRKRSRRPLSSASLERRQPRLGDLQGLGAEFLGQLDETFEAAAAGIGARRAAALQPEIVGQSVRVQPDVKHAWSSREVRSWRRSAHAPIDDEILLGDHARCRRRPGTAPCARSRPAAIAA